MNNQAEPMSHTAYPRDTDGEVFRLAFPDVPASERPYTMVSYGLPFDVACKKHCDGFLDVSRVYIIASKSLATKTNSLHLLETTLGEKHVGTWLGVPAHTPYDGILPILHDIRQKRADCLVTLGGGSLADGAKLLVYANENGVDCVEDLARLENAFMDWSSGALTGIGAPPKMKLIFIPTTLSGAEYSKFAGCTNPQTRMKVQFTHPGMFAKLIILSEELCQTTPRWVWLSTGVRAIDHCVEKLCSSNPRPECDVASERGLKRLVKALLAYDKDPNDSQAILQAQLGCNDGMTGLTLLVMAGASHGIGHNLGPLGVGHGETSCILLPAVMKWNASVNAAQQGKVKRMLWAEGEIADVLRERGLREERSDAGDALGAIFDELGMPRNLHEVGIGRDKWERLARNSLADLFVQSNPREMKTTEQVKEVLQLCAGD